MSMLDAALAYARKGFSVFPCTPEKRPYVQRGFKAATRDEQQIRNWWTQWPNAMIGVPTGKENGFWVLDVDSPKKDGDADGMTTLEELEKTYGKLPPTLRQKTLSGGVHYFFLYPSDGTEIKNRVNVLPKIDVRGEGGYIIIAPSSNGKSQYEWIDNRQPVKAPQWLLELVTKKAITTAGKQKQTNTMDSVAQKPTTAAGKQGQINIMDSIKAFLLSQSPSEDLGKLHPYVRKSLESNMDDIAKAPEGERNDTFFKKVATLAGFIPTGQLSESLLRKKAEEAFKKAHPSDYEVKEFEATITSAIKKGKTTPRTVPEKLPYGFRIVKEGTSKGLWFDKQAKKEGDPPISIRIGDPLHVLGQFRDDESKNWGLALEWLDPDGKCHRYPLTNEQLASSDSNSWRSQLGKDGYKMRSSRETHDLLARYLSESQPSQRITCVHHTGWHGNNGEAFVLPHIVLPESTRDSFILLNPPGCNPYLQYGTLEGWQNSIGKWAEGNHLLLFAICASLAAPLLKVLNQESICFHFVGHSSTGKTTALLAAASVWGKGSTSDGYILSWRSTDNGLEAQASLHSDTALCLDEISQVSPRVLQQATYMLGNNRGKSRANRNGAEKTIKSWRTIVLSTGEQGVIGKLEEEGGKSHAGQTVRMIDISADAGMNMGLFENLHGFSSPQEFADAIKQGATTNYGHVGPAFVEVLCSKFDNLKNLNLNDWSNNLFLSSYKKQIDGQVKRTASKLALCWWAGFLAADAGLVPWSKEYISEAIRTIFADWVEGRGGIGSWEDEEVVKRTYNLIETQGNRFQTFELTIPFLPSVHNRAGFRKDNDGKTIFYILKRVIEKEICQGVNPKRAAKALLKEGILVPESNDRLDIKLPHRVPDLGRQRVYAVCIHKN